MMSQSHPQHKGEPDYYVRNGNKIYIFENKDIRIAANIHGCKSYNSVKSEIFKKLVSKPGHRNSKVGLTQLLANIQRIADNKFVWDSSIDNPRIYPIMVVNDPIFSLAGINYIINKEFQRLIGEKRLPTKIKVYPVVLINMDVLIHYSGYFNAKKLSFGNVIDDYINYLNRAVKYNPDIRHTGDSILNRFLSFSSYMITKYHPVRGNDQIDTMLDDLQKMILNDS